jgi:hypothetical protein
MTGFELADPDRGVFAAAVEGGTAVILKGDRALGAAPAEGALQREDAGGGERFSLGIDGVSLEASLDPLGPEAVLEGELVGSCRLRLCRALGELRAEDTGSEIACLGVAGDCDDPPSGASLRRALTMVFGDGGLLAVAAARPPGAGDHAAEEIVAVLVEPDGIETRFERALLSTEYDAGGRHRRATLELEASTAADEPPIRAAGTRIGGASVELADGRAETAFFRWALEGRPALGRYEIVTWR